MKSLIAGAFALALISGGCATARADKAVSAASQKLAGYCGALSMVALGASLGGSIRQEAAWIKASAIINTVCANPPADTAAAIRVVADTLAAVEAVR
jgi:hypothetical protein